MQLISILSGDCVVCKIGSRAVYPIFRVGSQSLRTEATKTYTNEEIKFANIDVLIRDPGDRFVSGVNEYARQIDANVESTWQQIHDGKIIDKHFAPQYVWLMHLQKFHSGTVTLYPFEDIKLFTNLHKDKWELTDRPKKKVDVALLKDFVEKDYKLLDHLNKTLTLRKLLKNVLS
tara:strand:- start:23 stop:547 length:525 start_codon:yes stop_codon:yes gene_type:complete